jgi:hypothetical protein
MRRSTSTLGILICCVLPWSNAQTPAGGKKAKPPLVDELRQSYKGAALQVHQPGLMGLPIAFLAVAVSNFENGTLKQPGWSDRTFNANNAVWFQPGDHVVAEKFDVDTKHDRITFTLVNADRSYKAGLHFKFAKGFLETAQSDQIYEMISKVVAFEGGANTAAQQPPPPQQAMPLQQPAPAQQPPAAPQPAPQAAPADSAAVTPLIINGQVVGFGPAGVPLAPAGQAPAATDGRPWIPVVRNGQIIAYAPPGSTVWAQSGSTDSASTAPAPAPKPAEPPTVRLGQTGEEVQAILGTPDKVANLGSKVIFIYKDMKVTLTEGKVTDVQ